MGSGFQYCQVCQHTNWSSVYWSFCKYLTMVLVSTLLRSLGAQMRSQMGCMSVLRKTEIQARGGLEQGVAIYVDSVGKEMVCERQIRA